MARAPFLAGIVVIAAATSANALTINGVSNANGTTLAGALLGPASGFSLVAGSETYVGADDQGGTYSDFGTVGTPGALSFGDGIVLTTDYAPFIPLSNTDSSWDQGNIPLPTPESQPGGDSADADLTSVLSSAGSFSGVNDVNALEFSVTVDDPATQSLQAQFVFGTEEFPDQGVTDIFAFLVNGVNFAEFSDGSLINFALGAPSAAFYNDNTGGAFNLEYDGITNVLSVEAPIDPSLSEQSVKIAIADTQDRIFGSAVFLSSLSASEQTTGGGIVVVPPVVVPPQVVIPLPAGILLMVPALAGLGLLRRARSA